MTRAIEHHEDRQRFEWREDDTLSVLDYEMRDSIMTITHTGVPASLGGRGIAADLTRHALNTARDRGWKVRPACSYAAAYIRRNPEYQDLLA